MFQDSYVEFSPSTLQQLELEAITNILFNDYATLVIITAVGYDYILTFSDEIEYIWNQPWTRVSTVFLLARYFGLCSAIIFALDVCVFMLQAALINMSKETIEPHFNSCNILVVFGQWSVWTFIGAGDLIILLVVWALYRPSRMILGALLAVYAMEVTLIFVFCVMLSTRNNSAVFTARVLNQSFCVVQSSTSSLSEAIDTVQLILGALMCLLVIIHLVWQSLQHYKATNHFKLGPYMNFFAREGMFYCLAILSRTLLHVLCRTGNLPSDGWWILPTILPQFIPCIMIVPRFILSLRKLFARDHQRRDGSHVDTAFGLTWASFQSTASMIMFADAGENETEQNEEMSMEKEEICSVGCGV